jgi:signal transduction histidine kinase/CheY-like chemotaxis protein
MQKLLVVVVLPIIILLIFSANYIYDKYNILTNNKLELIYIDVMEKSSNLIHELQIERGLSASHLSEHKNTFFIQKLISHKNITDRAIQEFYQSTQHLIQASTAHSSEIYIKDTKRLLNKLKSIRKSIQEIRLKEKASFEYYTTLNKYLISIFDSFQIHTLSQKTNLDIMLLHRVIQLQEYAGQERAVISKLAYTNKIPQEEMHKIHMLMAIQKEEYAQINFLLKDSEFPNELQNIQNRYKNSFFNITRVTILNNEKKKEIIANIYKTIGYGGMIHHFTLYKSTLEEQHYKKFLLKKEILHQLIQEYLKLTESGTNEYITVQKLEDSLKYVSKEGNFQLEPLKILELYKKLESFSFDLDSQKWFETSSERINQIQALGSKIFSKIVLSIKTNIQETNNSLVWQIVFMLLTTILLLIATYLIANTIKYSISQLEIGINDFFNFLSFKSEKPKKINTHSDDEINEMAQNINQQIDTIEENLSQDKDFIHEITQIVMLMKDGDFSERPYFEPHNPNLQELKAVFDELIELISSKIKEQTDSLERLNSSLEDRVYLQTIELEKQIKNITKARDEAVQAEIAKDEFLANMSHEIRTPLNAILGFVTILKKRTVEENSLNYLKIIDSSGKSLLTIINDILDFSKIQSGKFEISPHPVDPVDEFSNATTLFASKAHEKHLIYSVYIDPNLPQSINVDSVRVKQVLSNILSNAIKFTPDDGEIKVKIVLEHSELVITVQDSGIGIEKENIKKVFTAFEQADGSTTRKYGGTGLGLSISSQLASLMGGKLSVTSEINKGSIFTFRVPIEILNASAKALVDRAKMASYKFSILNICQASKSQSKLLKKYLTDLGAEEVKEIDSYDEDDDATILFFIPDDEYNEEIVLSKRDSIAILRSSTIKLANLSYIQPLYAPFSPKAIVQAINDSNIKDLNIIQPKDTLDDEVEFNGSVLIAEDNKTNQMLISLLMEDYGITYTIANDGIEAVAMFKESKYDMILMDENMPKLNGIGAMQQIKAYESENRLVNTPIIALTASVLETDKEMFIREGMDGFVGKPIDNRELEKELSKYLKRV